MSLKKTPGEFPRERRRRPGRRQELTTNMEQARKHFNEMRKVFRRHNINFTKDTRILDLGTGMGKYLKFLIRRGNPAVGIDSKPRLGPMDREDFGLQVYEGDIENMKLHDETFGLVVGEGVFDDQFYKQNQPRMIREIARVLVSGGIFYPGHYEPETRSDVIDALKENFFLVNGGEYFKVYRKK